MKTFLIFLLIPWLAFGSYTSTDTDIIKVEKVSREKTLDRMWREFCALRWGRMNPSLYQHFTREIAEQRVDIHEDLGIKNCDIVYIIKVYGHSD